MQSLYEISIAYRVGEFGLWVVDKLRGSEKERQEVMVVQPPDSLRPRRFEPVHSLYLPHQSDVLEEYLVDHSFEVCLHEEPKSEQDEEDLSEIVLVASPVI